MPSCFRDMYSGNILCPNSTTINNKIKIATQEEDIAPQILKGGPLSLVKAL